MGGTAIDGDEPDMRYHTDTDESRSPTEKLEALFRIILGRVENGT
jgi:hypothetical protein